PELQTEDPVFEEDEPKSFGDYDVIAEIARGGMGVVYRGRHRAIGREAAVKTLGGIGASSSDLERFFREVRAAASIDHPNVVPVFDFGEDAGRYWFAMKLLPGGDLARPQVALDTSIRAVSERVEKIALAIEEAHRIGLIHRDLKPANILLDERGEPHVADFGLVKPLGDDSNLTMTGQIAGTASYMAPEQARGEPASEQSDVYSLGAILYEQLTGRPPFRAASALETLRRVVDDEPDWPRSVDRDVPKDLESICMRCLEKRPERRYETAKSLANDLRRYLDGQVIQARPVSSFVRAIRWSRRHQTATAVGILLSILFVTVSAAALWIERSRRETVDTLHQSFITEARALRTSDDPDRVRRGLQAIANAVEIRPTPELKNDAVSLLRMTGLVKGKRYFTETPKAPDGAFECLSRDGSRLAASAADGRIRIFDVEKDQLSLQSELKGIGRRSWMLRFDDSAARLVAYYRPFGEITPQIVLYSLEDGSILAQVDAVTPYVTVPSFGHGRVFACFDAGTIRSIDTTSGAIRDYSTFANDRPFSVAASNKRKEFAVSHESGKLAIVDIETGEVRSLDPKFPASRLAWNSSGRRLGMVGHSTEARIIDIDRPWLTHSLVEHEGDAQGIFFEPRGEFVFTTSTDETLRVWHEKSGRLVVTQRGTSAHQVAVSDDGSQVICGVNPNGVQIFDLDRPAVYSELSGGIRFDVSEDDRFVYSAKSNYGVTMWDAVEKRVLSASRDSVDGLLCVPGSGSHLSRTKNGVFLSPVRKEVTTHSDGEKVERLKIGPPQWLVGKGFRIEDLTTSADGRFAAVALSMSWVVILDLGERDGASPEVVRVLRRSGVNRATLSRDGTWVSTGVWMKEYGSVSNVATGETVLKVPGKVARGYFSPDDRVCVVATGENYQAFTIGSWERAWEVQRRDNSIIAGEVAFSSDGSLLGLWLTRRDVSLHDAKTGEQLV
ncbi:MAG: WD40 repeat domain-containing serine/threonine protein kinase, partial [Planctomycetota bacterium]